jgi:hypothetical protein
MEDDLEEEVERRKFQRPLIRSSDENTWQTADALGLSDSSQT